MVFFVKRVHVIGLAATILSGCAQMATSSDSTSTTAVSTSATASEPSVTETAVESKELSGEDLFQLLLAEIAMNRREYPAAAALYGQLSENHNDVAILERAVALNQSIGNYDALLQQAEKYVRLRPNDPSALAALTLANTATGDTPAAQASLERWLTLDPAADTSILLSVLDGRSDNELAEYAGMLEDANQTFPESGSLYYSRSRISAAQNDDAQALSLVNKSLEIQPNLQAGLFKYQLLENAGEIDAAGDVINSLYKQYPDNRQAAIQLTRHIYQHEPENLDQLQQLHTRFSGEPTIARSYALAAFAQKNYDVAEAVFQHLMAKGYTDEASYYLGRIDLVNALPDLASEHFEAVQNPPYLTSALAEWSTMARPEDETRLLAALESARTKHEDKAETLWRLEASYYQLIDEPELAWQSLDEALIRYPQSTALLYDQAMLAAQMKRYDTLEQNLLSVIDLDPDNINALNALGYTWADLDKNLDQASDMIDRALEADPDNPAFQDSKGWLLYRLGQPEKALTWLEQAYNQLENDEVAAHLAEVLWVLDRKSEARRYYDEIKSMNPESPYLGTLNELFEN